MMISTRGRYALRVMIDLAEHSEGYTPMKAVAQRQELSLKYLEQILPVLTKHHLIEGIQGRGGGYRLCRKPEEYTAGEILRLTEGDLAPVSCIGTDAAPCERSDNCRTLPLWSGLNKVVNAYLDSVTIADLMQAE